MFKYKKSLTLLVLAACLSPVFAQQVSVKATIDSTVMFIGQQSKMHLEISGPSSLNYSFPVFQGDTLIKGIELLSRSRIDTLENANNTIKLQTDYIVTSFDSGLYYIPPIKILAGTDTVFSNEMALKIVTYQVDTTKHQLFDIKGVQAPPFVFRDYLFELGLFVLLYFLVLLIIWYILKKKYGLFQSETKNDAPLLPPHLVAIMELDRIKAEKIWMKGKSKEYYTELSDILRKYIERRFQINALEMTTDEILRVFRRDRDAQSVYQNLKQVLQLADLVKFAKILPLENENEMSIMNSYLFVNQTKIEEVKPLEEQMEEVQGATQEAQTQEVELNDLAENDEMKKYQPK